MKISLVPGDWIKLRQILQQIATSITILGGSSGTGGGSYVGGSYVDRGEIGLEQKDFRLTDVITDGQWHSLDLSGIVPTKAKAVLILVQILSSQAGVPVGFLPYSHADDTVHYGVLRTQAANIWNDTQMIVAMSDQKIKYKFWATPGDFAMRVRGWWI